MPAERSKQNLTEWLEERLGEGLTFTVLILGSTFVGGILAAVLVKIVAAIF